ncbi:peptide chain release factor 2 [Stomatohabitans albus]|uniref:peptide chain release factor 2 n=1 Tax=Stomatohabitans albus TaxID=3110766 RepID=UPI00300D9FA9
MASEFASALDTFRSKVDEVERYLDIDTKRARLAELQELAADPSLWDDPQRGQSVGKELAAVEDDVKVYEQFVTKLDDLETLLELGEEEDDEESIAEVKAGLDELQADFAELEVRVLLGGEFDSRDAVLTIQAGAGGTESQDWAQMIARMITRWAEHHGFNVEEYETQYGDEAGIRRVTYGIKGPRAYGWLRSEHGVHRLVRISPFDSNARRHTSFASMDVVPEMDEAADDVVIGDDDLRIDVYRSSGPGGQGVNTTDSAVRITHLPTGLVVSCQNERSQLQNRETAMRLLKSKLLLLEAQKRQAELDAVRGEQADVAFGSQIRSYVLHPYQMVKDLRTGYETSATTAVLDGDLDGFMMAWLQWHAAGGNPVGADVD